MDCLDAKQKLEPCARGELSAADKAELDRHVATCEGCRLELELTRAVLGSSSTSADPADDPALVDPLLMEGGSDPVPFDAIEPEPTIEQERTPQAPVDGPGPPRVLTSQLPEEPEETLDLVGIQPSAYDPTAIHLPRPEESFGGSSEGPAPQEAVSEAAPSFDDISFADLATSSPALAPASSSEGGTKGKTESKSWDFEPVDVPRDSAPPEESLTFAKEALDRKRGNASRGKQRARILLVIGGAVGGLGLLGASVWMALAMREPVGSTEPSNIPAVVPPPIGQPEVTPSDSLEPSTEAPPALTVVDSSATKLVPPSVIKAGATAGVTGTGAIPPQAGSVKPTGSKQTPSQSGANPAGATSAATSPTSRDARAAAGTPSSSPSPAPAAAAFRDDELGPAPRREPRILTVEPDAKPGDPSYAPDEDAKPLVEEPTRPVITAPIFVPPSQGSSPTPGTGSAAGTGTGSAGPVDRLHTITATAEKNQDLETLRKLKITWKSMIRSGTPQERGRTKREYADCLWAIQQLTKRDADRKEALTAYREYVLHAPAGGADARTVKRMRHLEDILSDAR